MLCRTGSLSDRGSIWVKISKQFGFSSTLKFSSWLSIRPVAYQSFLKSFSLASAGIRLHLNDPRVLLNIKTIVNFSKALQGVRTFEFWAIG